jgi:hypothetical protein
MNLLISLYSIFKDEESLWWEEKVEIVGLEETSDGGQDSKEEDDKEENEEGHEEGVGLDDEGVGVMGLLQDPHPHTGLGVATSFTLL